MRELILYGTSACHLCERAEQLLANLLAEHSDWQVELVDIADSDTLIERYGTRIPVLAGSAGELAWPFDREAVSTFVDGEGG
ncbi:glutaredoxin family protein [Spongiibacter sp.]|uniref:glutaredoxin family protein n=1 Tax=Spongiibacter sp. TaxID=2024860 RepID=UPI003563FBFF